VGGGNAKGEFNKKVLVYEASMPLPVIIAVSFIFFFSIIGLGGWLTPLEGIEIPPLHA
jgi:hypothetical protein